MSTGCESCSTTPTREWLRPSATNAGVSLAASLAFYLAEQNASLTFAAQGLAEPTLWGFLHHLALVEPADPIRRFSIRFRWGRTSTWYLAGGRAGRLSLPCGNLPTWCFLIRENSEKFSRDPELIATYTVHHFQAAWGSRNPPLVFASGMRAASARGGRSMSTIRDLIQDRKIHSLQASETVMTAALYMTQCNIGAVPVMDGERLAGVFSERDILMRVVAAQRDPETTLLPK